ncbi:MAG: hydroxymethylglutaryl-CoA reductase, degradative, partial [Anaerolineae bacterium]
HLRCHVGEHNRAEERAALTNALSPEQANAMIENVVGLYNLPLGIATNFRLNGEDALVPMAVEEPSVVAGVSYAAKLARAGGGFITRSSEPLMIGQVQVLDVPDLEAAAKKVLSEKEAILQAANRHHPTIQALEGGAKDVECRALTETAAGPMLVVHLLYDCRDAMGANAVNTAAEAIAPLIEALTGGRVNLRILSNLSDRRTATAECAIPAAALSRNGLDGREVARGFVEAWAFADADPYRAATHNKGVMNGVDAVAVATGNDWRAIEAGAHAFAARTGRYRSLTEWRQTKTGDLRGRLHMPLSVGTVGGATKVHPTARVALKILGHPTARRLAEIMVAVGLAQNLAAIRALATEGIQRGHMRLHARQVALAAGATGAQVQRIADRLVAEGNIREARARELVKSEM